MKELRINKITTGYQITIPAHYRKQNHLKIGDYITFVEEGDKLIVKPVKNEKPNAVKMLNDLFKKEIKSAEFDGLSEEEIMDIINEEIKDYRRSKKFSKAAPTATANKVLNPKNHRNAKKKKNNY